MPAKNLATNAAHFARNGVDLEQVMSQGHILTTTTKDTITWMPAKRHSVGQMENYARLMITNPEHKSVSYIMVKRYLLVTKGK